MNISIHMPDEIVKKISTNSYLKNLATCKVGYFEKHRSHLIIRATCFDYAMHYCVDGSGWIKLNGTTIKINKGDAFFYKSGAAHHYGSDTKDPWTVYYVHFWGDAVEELYKEMGITDSSPIFHIGDSPKSILILKEILQILKGGYAFSNILHASACYLEFLSLLIKMKSTSITYSQQNIDIEDIINFMVENVNTTLTLDTIAERSNMSKYHFARTFKEKTGYPPVEYYNRLKIQKACEYLITSSMSIKEISYCLAFSNQYYFSETFKRIMGVSPQDYKKNSTE